ncbi:MAG TPA: L,D-transpeptidase [Nevskiaceae bacterium]|nr:L,D-transpeptidase [Nevskiaceae bacterium]
MSVAATAAPQPDKALAPAPSTEARLLEAWETWHSGDPAGAEKALRSLLAQRPNYKLGWLIYGDLLSAMSGGKTRLPLPSTDARVHDLQGEMERRLIKRDLTSDAVPGNLIYLSGDSPRAIVVDLSQGRMFLMERGDDGWHRVRDNYAGIGALGMNKRDEHDFRTPVGVYHINGYIPGASLPDMYGAGALPLDYPNDWDHADNRYGHGIWIHGVPRDTYVRAPQSSQGCVTIANEDFEWLHRTVGAGTPVVLADNVQWLFAEEAEALKQEWLDRLEQWRLALLSGDSARVRGFYKKAPKAAAYHELEVEHINVFEYPGEKDLVLAQFRMARNQGGATQVEQFWRRDASGAWKVVFEKSGGGVSPAIERPAKKKASKRNVAAR